MIAFFEVLGIVMGFFQVYRKIWHQRIGCGGVLLREVHNFRGDFRFICLKCAKRILLIDLLRKVLIKLLLKVLLLLVLGRTARQLILLTLLQRSALTLLLVLFAYNFASNQLLL